ncbi:hypothetical protein B0T17DRAFT_270436 [Bombardia bombarda]|uniref:Uncharacterized protein n=1 Tax=Bombardia bombarda TaxID=252184 RepID=A0AA39X128_9PEZI|nr:hypothetical protein B0T17DRAFT_270436 [Bombardia bombarda]
MDTNTMTDSHNWSRTPPTIMPRRNLKGKGPRSLAAMSATVLADNISKVSEEALAELPEQALWRLWKDVAPRGLSLEAWKMLSKLLLTRSLDTIKDKKTDKRDSTANVPLDLYHHRQEIENPSAALSVYTAPLATVDFLTHLTIHKVDTFQTQELMALAELKNLAVLDFKEICSATSRDLVTDSLVRGWSEKQNPFPALRILAIYRNRTLTKRSLRYISRFPSLAIYDVLGEGLDWIGVSKVAEKFSWVMYGVGPRSSFRGLIQDREVFGAVEDRHGSADCYLPFQAADRAGIDDWSVKLRRAEPDVVEEVGVPEAYSTPTTNQPAAKTFVSPVPRWSFWALFVIARIEKSTGISYDPTIEAAWHDDFALPSKPFVSLRLSGPDKPYHPYTNNFVSYRFTPSTEPQKEPSQPKSSSGKKRVTIQPGSVRANKRQKTGDILSSFGIA